MKKRLLRVLALAALGPLLVVLGAGFLSSENYEGSRRAVLDAPVEKVGLVNDVQGLPRRNQSVRSVELLESRDGHAGKWREHLEMGQEALIEVTDWKRTSADRPCWKRLRHDRNLDPGA